MTQVQLLSTILKDVWATLKALNGLTAYIEGASNSASAAAGLAAECGRSLLAGLVAVSRAAVDLDAAAKGELMQRVLGLICCIC